MLGVVNAASGPAATFCAAGTCQRGSAGGVRHERGFLRLRRSDSCNRRLTLELELDERARTTDEDTAAQFLCEVRDVGLFARSGSP